MAGIEFGYGGIPEPTICGPVSQFKELTTVQNAYQLGNYGFVFGAAAVIVMVLAYKYAGPALIQYGESRGWWS